MVIAIADGYLTVLDAADAVYVRWLLSSVPYYGFGQVDSSIKDGYSKEWLNVRQPTVPPIFWM